MIRFSGISSARSWRRSDGPSTWGRTSTPCESLAFFKRYYLLNQMTFPKQKKRAVRFRLSEQSPVYSTRVWFNGLRFDKVGLDRVYSWFASSRKKTLGESSSSSSSSSLSSSFLAPPQFQQLLGEKSESCWRWLDRGAKEEEERAGASFPGPWAGGRV